jgi:hypothetical protein
MRMMDRGARDANMESAARAGYGTVAAQARRIAELEAALREIADGYRGSDDDRPQAFRFSQVALKALKGAQEK